MKYLKQLKTRLTADITTVPAIFTGSYYRAVDGLRGLSVLMVILGHLGFNYITRPAHVFIDSNTGVHIFFVISGFLITTLLIKEKIESGSIHLKRFYTRRVLRIIPVAYLFLVILIILNLYFKLQIGAFDFIASFLFFKNMPVKNEPLTAHFWTLATEGQFYLLFPYLLSKSINGYFKLIFFMVIAIPAISITGYYWLNLAALPHSISIVIRVIMYSFWKGPLLILIGSVFSILVFKKVIDPEQAGRFYFLSFILLLTAIVVHNRMLLFYRHYISDYASAIIIGYVIALSINSRNFLSAILNHPVLVWLGTLSYSLYMWQQLFIGNRPWEPWLHGLSGYPVYVVVLIKLVALLVIAPASYYFYEVKFLKLKKRFSYLK